MKSILRGMVTQCKEEQTQKDEGDKWNPLREMKYTLLDAILSKMLASLVNKKFLLALRELLVSFWGRPFFLKYLRVQSHINCLPHIPSPHPTPVHTHTHISPFKMVEKWVCVEELFYSLNNVINDWFKPEISCFTAQNISSTMHTGKQTKNMFTERAYKSYSIQ